MVDTRWQLEAAGRPAQPPYHGRARPGAGKQTQRGEATCPGWAEQLQQAGGGCDCCPGPT
jgi:hypothetical protein